MNKKDYLNRLLDLKRFLHDNPEQYKVYRDLHIDRMILATKHEIYLEEDELHVQDRLYIDGFETTDYNPFL